MTLLSAPLSASRAAPHSRAEQHPWLWPSAALACVFALGLLMTWGRTLEVWNTGAFYDTDDALRMVQVRDLMNGQRWFDMSVARMDAPAGVFMHWSRVVDVPLAALIALFRLFAAPETAERLARLAFPALLTVALYAACAQAAAVIVGARARIPAILLAFASGALFGQFIPGRIDHHAPQIVLLVLATAAMLSAFDAAKARHAAVSGALCAASLSISLENLPFIVILCAAPPLLFVAQGDAARPALVSFATGLGAGLIAMFAATVGPSRWFLSACDAYSFVHIAAGLAGCAALLALAAASPVLRTAWARAPALGAASLAPLAALLAVAPSCLGDPFVGLDPLVRDVWLRNVAEVEPLTHFLRSHPNAAATMGAPILAAILAAAAAALWTRGAERQRYLLLGALLTIGLLMTVWGVRVFSSASPLAAIIGACFVVKLAERAAISASTKPVLMSLAALPFAPLAYAMALPSDPPGRDGPGSLSCMTPAALAPLDALPAGLVLAPIDGGSHLLAFTHHSVLGAPYHRNNHGNRAVIDAMLAAPDAARAIVKSSGADYVAICGNQVQAKIMAERAPDGLAAALLAGRTPDWLTPIEASSPQHLYKVIR